MTVPQALLRIAVIATLYTLGEGQIGAGVSAHTVSHACMEVRICEDRETFLLRGKPKLASFGCFLEIAPGRMCGVKVAYFDEWFILGLTHGGVK